MNDKVIKNQDSKEAAIPTRARGFAEGHTGAANAFGGFDVNHIIY